MKQCKECGKDFEPKNDKGTFCSPKCRQKSYRKKTAKLVWLGRTYENNLKDSDKWTKAPNEGILKKIEDSKPELYKNDPVVAKKNLQNIISELTKPERLPGESSIDYRLRVADWKEKNK